MKFAGYAHNFERYVGINDQVIDRLEQSLQYGFLSPRQANIKGVPFRRNTNVTIRDAKDIDDVIFLFPLRTPDAIPRWLGAITTVFSSELEVLTLEEMMTYQNGNWVNLSPTYGEVYMFGRIDPAYLREIILPSPNHDEKEAVRKLLHKYTPELFNKVVIS